MNYVGQLAGSVLGRVRDLYKGVNPATLSGSIDVIVVQQPDGSFRSSPFHVRFGKLGILRSAEMTVDIEVNGEPVDLQMRLGENGEAFFIQEMEEDEDEDEEQDLPITPALHAVDLSPTHISNDIPEASPGPKSTLSTLDTPARRQRWSNRRKKSRGDETLGTLDKDGIAVLPSCDSIYFSFSDQPDEFSSSPSKDLHSHSEEDLFQLSGRSRTPSPKSDSELEMKAGIACLPENCMEWNWGRLPQVTRSDISSQISQSAPPSPTKELVEISVTAPADNEILDTTKEEDEPFRIVLLEGTADTSQFHDPSDAPSVTVMFSPVEVLSPDSQEVSLYFPNSEPHPPPPPHPRSSENIPEDNMESYVVLSLCGGLSDSWNIPEDRFQKFKVSYSDFCQNPSLIDDPRLVLQIHNKYYNWATAAPILLCMQAFNQDLPQGVIDQLSQQRMPPQSRRWWFSWRRRSLSNQLPVTNLKDDMEPNEDPGLNRLEKNEEVTPVPSAVPVQPGPYRKSLRLTSEQIRSLNLLNGPNEVVFSVCTKFQGTCRTRAQIYLWDSTDRIIVSDIDGTVTRSDALGHILPQLGKDWTQPGIGQLYDAIHKNGYKFLYCSARSVGLADITKTFLQGVSEGGYTLPPGPLLLSPSSLFTALHREVIEKTPEHFKIACLSDICQLFTDPSPFHAAFGNRPNDVLAYREVGVPESRIFTVNPRGELTQDLNSGFKSSYSALCDLANVMFPPPSPHSISGLLSPLFNDFSYWRDPVNSISEEELVHIS